MPYHLFCIFLRYFRSSILNVDFLNLRSDILFKMTMVSPPLFIVAITWVAFGYVILLIPVILCTMVIFCLPCLLLGVRALRLGEAAGTGAQETEINKLPVVIYRKKPTTPGNTGVDPTTLQSDNLQDSNESLSKKSRKGKRSAWSKMWRPFTRRRNSKSGSGDSMESYTDSDEIVLYLPDEDAVCCICLGEYEDGIELRKLLCGHHFHTGCVDGMFN